MNDFIVEQEEYQGYTITIQYDTDPMNPREWDNLGTMVCWHRRYNLGDEQISRDDALEQWNKYNNKKKYLCLPLFLYDHSGITMSTSPFSCSWDSGQVGFIYISYEKIQNEYGKMDTETLNRVREYLIKDVEVYDRYLTGQVYGYIISDDTDDHIDSCWGFFDEEDCLSEAKAYIDACLPVQLKLEVA